MNISASLLVGFGLGIVVGLAYFAGLWWTVCRLPFAAKPQRLLCLSRAARQLPTLGLMVLAIRCDPALFLAMLPGFLLGRFLIGSRVIQAQGEGAHAAQS